MLKIFFGLSSFLLTATIMAGTTSTLILRGTIPEILDVQVTPDAIASNLPLTTTQTNTKVATVLESSNSNTGYKISISSANLGKLVRTSGNEQFLYTLKYDGVSLDLTNTVELVRGNIEAVTVNKNLTISYTGVDASTMVAGDYGDTITFTISSN